MKLQEKVLFFNPLKWMCGFFHPLPSPYMPVQFSVDMWAIRVSISAESKQTSYAFIPICLIETCKDWEFSHRQHILKNTYYVLTLLQSLGIGRNPDIESHLYVRHIEFTVPRNESFLSICFPLGLKKLMQTSITNELDYIQKNFSFLGFLLQ